MGLFKIKNSKGLFYQWELPGCPGVTIANYGKTSSICLRKFEKLATQHSNCTLGPIGSHLLINLLKVMIFSLLGIPLTGTVNCENGVLF